MSSSEAKTEASTGVREPGTIEMKLEVINLPVSDVDRAKRFYQALGWRMDGDFAVGAAKLPATRSWPPDPRCP